MSLRLLIRWNFGFIIRSEKWAEKIVVGEYCRDGSAEDVLITLHYDISRESSHLESVYLG